MAHDTDCLSNSKERLFVPDHIAAAHPTHPHSASDPHDFSGVENVIGIERLFDGAHDTHRLTMLGD
jgi:hypothetical protein